MKKIKCKIHQACNFKGTGKHEGCYMHGVIDSCTNEHQQLFKDGMLAYVYPKPPTKEEQLIQDQRRHEENLARLSRSSGGSGGWLFAGIILGILLL